MSGCQQVPFSGPLGDVKAQASFSLADLQAAIDSAGGPCGRFVSPLGAELGFVGGPAGAGVCACALMPQSIAALASARQRSARVVLAIEIDDSNFIEISFG